MARRALPFVVLVLLVTQAFADKDWIQVTSPHFTVMTDGGKNQGKEIALRFEQMRAVFGTLFHKTRVNTPVPLTIIAFRNQSEFRNYAPLWKGKPVELSGFYQGDDDRDFIVLDLSSNDPYAVVFHEYAHLLLRANFPKTPVWFDEGFAEYFSSMRVTDKTVEYGHVPENLTNVLQSNRWMPLLTLFGIQHDSATYNERDKQSLFYAQSWITVHYIMSNDKLPDAAKYLQLTQIQRQPNEESVKQAFGMEPAALEKAVHDYFNGSGRYFRAEVPEVEMEPTRSEKMDDVTVRATLADLQGHSKDHQQQALTEFQSILEKDPGNELALRGIGYLYLRQNRYQEAAELFRKASLRPSKDARLHYLNALLMNRMAIEQGKRPADPEEMKQELETAITLEPGFADAYNLLAFALAAERKYDAAVAAERKAIELNASHESYQVNLANLYLQWQKWDDAEAILARLQQSSDPEVKEDATKLLASLQSSREMAAQMLRERELRRDDVTAPQWQKKPGQFASNDEREEEQNKPDNRKTLYMSGELERVDCSQEPAAILTIRSGRRVMRMRAANYKKLLVMGADEFSCDWRNRKVLVNYKPGGKTDGDLVTVELRAGN